MKALPHQERKAKTLVRKLRLYGLTIFAGEIRSGKTAPFIMAAQALAEDHEIVIITKKGAIEGVKKFTPTCDVTNYHQAKNIDRPYKVVILDEAHKYITGYPKRSTIWKDVARITYAAEYIIFASGTPTPESLAMLFNMLALSLASPWAKYPKFTDWHKDYGIAYNKVIGYDDYRGKPKLAKAYDRVDEHKVMASIEHLIVSMTRKEAGHKYEPVDKLHYIPLSAKQSGIVDALVKDKLYELPDDYTILADTTAKEMQKLHQIAGGFVNTVDDYDESKTAVYEFRRKPKVQYIKDNFDPEETIILAFYIPEQEYLAKIFPHTGSITKNSAGVDYSHFKNMVIYSFGFPAETYEQVRGRQANMMTRNEEITVHFLISGIDEYVYQAVSNKESFTARWYQEHKR